MQMTIYSLRCNVTQSMWGLTIAYNWIDTSSLAYPHGGILQVLSNFRTVKIRIKLDLENKK